MVPLSFLSCLLLHLVSSTSNEPPQDYSESLYNALQYKYRAALKKASATASESAYRSTMQTICIMTRDNVCLSTDMYTPAKELHSPPYDVLYAKTPYGKDTLAADATVAEPQGWVFLAQDVRGRGESNGSYSFWRTSGNDTMDTMEWVLNQNWSTTNIAAIGVSANALAQYADLIGVTQFPVGSQQFDYYNGIFQHLRIAQLFLGDGMGWHTVYQGGAYRTGLISGWLTDLHEADMIETVQQHEAFDSWWVPLCGPYNDQWKILNQTVIHFAGFYDIFSTPQIRTALAVNASAQSDAQGKQILVVDPGGHCPMGEIVWPNDLYGFEFIEYWGIPAVRNAFEYGDNNDMSDFDIHQYFPFNALWYQLGPGELGSNGNYWIQAESFPPFVDTEWYLTSNGGLSSSPQSTADKESYFYNPKNPVETWGGNNLILQPCGPWDQTKVEQGRDDILHFTSANLTEDVALVGEIRLNLFVESDAVDTDFTAKLIDVHPNGKPYLVQDGILRMRWRDTATWTPGVYQTSPSPAMQSGKVYNITIDLAFMSFIFNAGHKISVSVSSSNYKRFSINYNSGNFVIDGDKDWRNATNTVHFGSSQYPSKLILPVVELSWLQQRRVPQAQIDKVHQAVQEYYDRDLL